MNNRSQSTNQAFLFQGLETDRLLSSPLDGNAGPFPQHLNGFRLHKVEINNWGTFHKEVYTMRPGGESTLLVGQNGTGKSTIVDAILTLLVRSAIRNYNVAAGAKKQERSEKSYIQGAHGNHLGSEENAHLLRPESNTKTILLACFKNGDPSQDFTIAQVLYLSNGKPERLYCFSNGERSIEIDFQGLTGSDTTKKILEGRGFRVSPTFNEYQDRFRNRVNLSESALNLFNETVAVKDIDRLDIFIRKHMLEKTSTEEDINDIIKDFDDLKSAHDSLVRIRDQRDKLRPIKTDGLEFKRLNLEMEAIKCQLNASQSFEAHYSLGRLEPFSEQLRDRRELSETKAKNIEGKKNEKERELFRTEEQLKKESSGRLGELPHLIKAEDQLVKTTGERYVRYTQLLQQIGIHTNIDTEDSFIEAYLQIEPLSKSLAEQADELDKERNALLLKNNDKKKEHEIDKRELAALQRQKTKLPYHEMEFRSRLYRDLNIREGSLPYAAELIAVKPGSEQWELSLEILLRSFALSLLVPERHYKAVVEYVESTRIADNEGRGRKLTYMRIPDVLLDSRWPGKEGFACQHLAIKQHHEFDAWLKQELLQRFNYQCCATSRELQMCNERGMTPNGHFKHGKVRHERDDRDHVRSPRFYVLGWDNAVKRRELEKQIEENDAIIKQWDAEISRLTNERDRTLRDKNAAEEALGFKDFIEIDHFTHAQNAKNLRREKELLEKANTNIAALNEQISSLKKEIDIIADQYREEAGNTRSLKDKIDAVEKRIKRYQESLKIRSASGALVKDSDHFGTLKQRFEAQFGLDTCEPDDIEHEFRTFLSGLYEEQERIEKDIQPIRQRLAIKMSAFLEAHLEFKSEISAEIDYLDDFIELYDEIEREGLPEHLRQFKRKMTDNAMSHIQGLKSTLESARGEIARKIASLNKALSQLQYEPGKFLELEASSRADSDISQFREDLDRCIEKTNLQTDQDSEKRFHFVEKLVKRLGDEKDRTWRGKVTDVREWFQFVAHVKRVGSLELVNSFNDSGTQSGGEKTKFAFTILAAAIAYQYEIDHSRQRSDRFYFVVIDEMFSKIDEMNCLYALDLFKKFHVQLFLVAPLGGKVRVVQNHVKHYILTTKEDETSTSDVLEMTAQKLDELVQESLATDESETRDQ